MKDQTGVLWEVLGPGSTSLFFRCRCGGCGVEKDVNKKNLRAGITKSCGCQKVKDATTHGHSRTPTYRTWQRVIDRTENPNAPRYSDYGGRGIRMCARWRGNFLTFLADMGPLPEGLSIDRKDNDGGYWCGKVECPDCGPAGREPNCQWATRSTQQRNKRTTKLHEYQGRHLSAAAWAEELGIPFKVLSARLDRGWTMSRAVGQPRGAPRGKNSPKSHERQIEFEGVTKTTAEWAAQFGLPLRMFLDRLYHGWSMAAIRDAPPGKPRGRHRTPPIPLAPPPPAG